jgi:hypothetical protein
MGRPATVPRLGLAAEVIECRAHGLTLDATTARLNALLEGGGIEEAVSRSSVARFLRTIDDASAALAHRADLAERNAVVGIDVAERIRAMLAKLDQLLPIAEADTNGKPNWPAVLGVIKEIRELTRLWVSVMERVHSSERVERFQREVLAGVERASPAVAAEIRRELRSAYELRRAELVA